MCKDHLKDMMEQLFSKLNQSHPLLITSIGLCSALVLGYVDYVSGHEISFAIFYVMPVAFVTWFAGSSAGLLIALFSAVVWYGSNHLTGEVFSNPAIPYWNTVTRLGFFIIITLLLSKLRQTLEDERALSRQDFLTGALNSRAFYEVLTAELERHQRHKRPFTLAYLDLDNFKMVNDRFGHAAGDALLKTIAGTIREKLRGIDAVARLGGDEFAILLIETEAEAARVTIERLRELLLDVMRQQQWLVTFSIGIVTCKVCPSSGDALINMADNLMYEVKKSGKNGIQSALYTGEDRRKDEVV